MSPQPTSIQPTCNFVNPIQKPQFQSPQICHTHSLPIPSKSRPNHYKSISSRSRPLKSTAQPAPSHHLPEIKSPIQLTKPPAINKFKPNSQNPNQTQNPDQPEPNSDLHHLITAVIPAIAPNPSRQHGLLRNKDEIQRERPRAKIKRKEERRREEIKKPRKSKAARDGKKNWRGRRE